MFFDGAEYINKDGQKVVEEIDVGVAVEDVIVVEEYIPEQFEEYK